MWMCCADVCGHVRRGVHPLSQGPAGIDRGRAVGAGARAGLLDQGRQGGGTQVTHSPPECEVQQGPRKKKTDTAQPFTHTPKRVARCIGRRQRISHRSPFCSAHLSLHSSPSCLHQVYIRVPRVVRGALAALPHRRPLALPLHPPVRSTPTPACRGVRGRGVVWAHGGRPIQPRLRL